MNKFNNKINKTKKNHRIYHFKINTVLLQNTTISKNALFPQYPQYSEVVIFLYNNFIILFIYLQAK